MPEAPAARPIAGENVLLVSDLHLGEACKNHTRIEYLKKGALLDQQFCDFLDHHTKTRLDDRPWRMVLGGDLFDFLQVTVTPPGTDAERKRFGLGTTEAESVWKLDRIVERHHRVFVFLADFVAEGHRIEIVQGNHDQELFWPAVQVRFVEHLVALYFGDEAHPERDKGQFASRVHFNPWFYYQPGFVYVEHGHRFDDFCATPPQTCPLRPQAEEELAQPISSLAIRYIANLERGFSTHDKEHWRIPDYARYYYRRGWSTLGRVISSYFRLIARSIAYHLEHGRFSSELAEAQHKTTTDALVNQGLVSRSQLEILDALDAVPIMSTPLGIYTILGLGEWMIGAVGLLGLLITVLTSWGWAVDLALISLMIGGATATARVLRRKFSTNVRSKLEHAAQTISETLDVPVVAMGHSHHATRLRLKHNHRALYLNTGCFFQTERPRHDADAPCTCPAVFVVLPWIEATGRAQPTHHRWCAARARPEPY